MANNFPPTALETETCPPHRYYIGRDNMGICLKCTKTKDFAKLMKRREESSYIKIKAINGGHKSGVRRKAKVKREK